MAQQKVQLRKLRDFGENFSDTFQFIRQEFKPLLAAFLLVGGVFMLIAAILTGLYQKDAFSFLDQIGTGVFEQQGTASTFTSMYFLAIGFTLVTVMALRTIAAVYMRYYEEQDASPTVQQVWAGFFRHFPRVFLCCIPQYILVGIGLMFCGIPGIYLMVVFGPFIFVVVNEEPSFSNAFSRCFDIVKENFWVSLGIYLVAYIIYAMSAGVVGLIIGLATGAVSYFTTKEISTSANVLMSALNIVQYVFYVIFFVSAGLHYYNLAEAKDGTGLARRLEGLGNTVNPNEGIEEQY